MTTQLINKLIQENQVFIFSKSYCGFCSRVKSLFQNYNVQFKAIELDNEKNGSSIQAELTKMTKQSTVPSVFIGGVFYGGSSDIAQKERDGSLFKILDKANVKYEK
eukprot:gene1249-11338_t